VSEVGLYIMVRLTYICMYIGIRMYVCYCVCTCMYVYIYTCICICIYTYICIYEHTGSINSARSGSVGWLRGGGGGNSADTSGDYERERFHTFDCLCCSLIFECSVSSLRCFGFSSVLVC